MATAITGTGVEEDVLETVHLRNEFYRDAYYRSVKIALGLAIFAALASLGDIIALAHHPAPVVIAVSEDGRIVPVTPLDNPMLSDAELFNWTTNAVTSALTLDFVNYRKVLTGVRENFTADGYREFIKALDEQQVVAAVVRNKFVVSATPTGAPVILAEGKLWGRYTWKLQLPVLITYESASVTQPQNMVVTVLVQRASEVEHRHGVAIVQFIAVNKS